MISEGHLWYFLSFFIFLRISVCGGCGLSGYGQFSLPRPHFRSRLIVFPFSYALIMVRTILKRSVACTE